MRKHQKLNFKSLFFAIWNMICGRTMYPYSTLKLRWPKKFKRCFLAKNMVINKDRVKKNSLNTITKENFWSKWVVHKTSLVPILDIIIFPHAIWNLLRVYTNITACHVYMNILYIEEIRYETSWRRLRLQCVKMIHRKFLEKFINIKILS